QIERTRARATEPDLDLWLDSEADALADELVALDTEIANTRPSSEAHTDLLKWERVISEAHGRLARARGSAPRVDPIAVSHATRLRNEWRYLEQVADSDRRWRSRRYAHLARAHYEAYLAQLGATSFEDLAVVGTGYGNSDADIAIREAAAVVSMAEQRCTALRAELAQPGRESLMLRREHVLARTEALLGHPPGTQPVAELQAIRRTRAVKVDVRAPDDESELRERVDLATREHERLGAELQALERESGAIERGRLDLADRATKGLAAMGPVAIESLIGTAIAEPPSTTMTRPLIVDDIFGALAPRSRHRAFAVLAGLSRSRQVIIVSRGDEVAQWTAELPTGAALIWSARQAEASA
ncbi:MAG: hypothetical protein SGJ13_01260, partial [Actinomycetota bacterium]|nr:hypothetical protein [Actinomycetota bacterium]